jgi:processive 1,2-diacylglycerol beta-glucosyltransferase
MRIDLVFFDVTSGHRSSALALAKAIEMQHPQVRIRVLNFTDILRYQPFLQSLAHAGIDLFNWGVRREQAYFARQQIQLFQLIQANLPASMIEQVAHFWREDPPDGVVSVMPICNWLLERALHHLNPHSAYIVVPVDFEEPHRNYWFDRRMDCFYLAPTTVLFQQAQQRGIAPQRVHAVRGMPIDPLFYQPAPPNRAEALQALGLDPQLPTILVGFGGQGSVLVQRCAEQLDRLGNTINVIFLCGRDAQLRQQIEQRRAPYRMVACGFSPEPPAASYHMADILVGKPGTMTITEALITRTPFLAIESRSLAVVQRGNEAWLRQSGVGEVIRLPDLAAAVERLLRSTTVNQQIEAEWHRGVFDIAAMIVAITQQHE